MQLTQILYTYFYSQLIYKTMNFLSTKILIISFSLLLISTYKWVKVFKNGPSKISGRKPLKKLIEADHITSNFLKVVFQKFYLVRS